MSPGKRNALVEKIAGLEDQVDDLESERKKALRRSDTQRYMAALRRDM